MRGKGEGSIYQRHADDCAIKRGSTRCSCPWVACLDFGIVSGVRHRPTRYADNKRGATKALEELRLLKAAGVMPSNATLGQWCDYWLRTLAVKPSTATYYAQYVEQWIKPAIGSARLAKVGPEHVRELHDRMRAAGKSPTTIRNAHATLRRALALALIERRVVVNWASAVKGPAAADNPHPILSMPDAGNVFVVASRDPRELARVHVAILCGLRQGEALALRWDNVRPDHLRVEWSAARVDGKRVLQRPKTARSLRNVPLPVAARMSLEAWRQTSGGRGFVFHGYDGPGSIEDASRDSKAWHAILADALVAPVPLHGARGTCATMLRAQGFSERMIADYLGQADVRVLMEHYLHSSHEERAAAALSLGEVFEIGA